MKCSLSMGKGKRGQIKVQHSDSGHALRKSFLRVVVGCGIIIFLITFLIYTPALKNRFVWDDALYVYENNHIRSLNPQSLSWMFTAFHATNWHPLTWLSHAIDYALFALNPLGHHLISIIIHGMNTFLVFLLAIQLMLREQAIQSKAPSPSSASISFPLQLLIAAGVTAMLFGIHPLHVESVAWVAERKDVLCALFFLLTISSYLYYVRSADKKNRWVWFIFCLMLFAASLMAKPMAVTLPLVLLLLDIYPLKRLTLHTYTNNITLSVLLEKVPFLCLSLVSSVFTVLAQRAGGALLGIETLSLRFRLLNAFHSLIFYLTKLIWPARMVPFYPLSKTISAFDLASYIISAILTLSITGGCIWLWKRGRCVFLIVWAYYLITLLPVLGIIQVGGQSAADRYVYLPSASIFLLAGMGVAQLYSVTVRKKNIISSGGVIVAVIFILFGRLTAQQIKIWQDSETLWTHVVKSFPGRVPIAHNNLGLAYESSGLHDRAAAEFEKAIASNPVFAHAHNNLGNIYMTQGKYDKAIEEYEKAIASDPKSATSYYNLGNTFYARDNYDEAITQYKKALSLNPNYAKAHNSLGIAYYKINNYSDAKDHFEKALALGYKVDLNLLEFVKHNQPFH